MRIFLSKLGHPGEIRAINIEWIFRRILLVTVQVEIAGYGRSMWKTADLLKMIDGILAHLAIGRPLAAGDGNQI